MHPAVGRWPSADGYLPSLSARRPPPATTSTTRRSRPCGLTPASDSGRHPARSDRRWPAAAWRRAPPGHSHGRSGRGRRHRSAGGTGDRRPARRLLALAFTALIGLCGNTLDPETLALADAAVIRLRHLLQTTRQIEAWLAARSPVWTSPPPLGEPSWAWASLPGHSSARLTGDRHRSRRPAGQPHRATPV